MKKPLRLKKIQQMTTHDLKSYAHGQGKKAKRLRDEMARLGNRAAAAERAMKRAHLELATRAELGGWERVAHQAVGTHSQELTGGNSAAP